jgi:hypothetical protein
MWLLIPERLYGKSWKGWWTILGHPVNVWISLIAFCGASGAALAWLVHKHRRFKDISKTTWVISGLLLMHAALVMAEQIRHAVGYGGYNVRYLLPMWLPLSLVLAAGALAWNRLRGMGVLALVTVSWLGAFGNTLWYITQVQAPTTGIWQHYVNFVTVNNGLPYAIIPVLLCGMVFGVVLQGLSLWRLASQGT